MDPHTGEMLALASSPRMDLNQFWNYGTIYKNASEFDRAVSMPYEPGSTLKILTMAAALDTGTVAPIDLHSWTPATSMVGGATIHNWDDAGLGPAGYDRLPAALAQRLPGLGLHQQWARRLSTAT